MRISDWSSDVCSSDLMQASRKPLVVTHHGKDAHVLISLADYRRLDGGGEAPGDRLAASQAAIVESLRDAVRSAERRVGKACVSTCRSRWWPYHSQKTYNQLHNI